MTETTQMQPALTSSTPTPTLNEQQAILIQRLKKQELSVNRFLKVGPDKKAFEREWEKHLYSPEDFDKTCYCFTCRGRQPHERWGITGKDFLVLVDTDKKEMYDLLSKVLPETFEVTSPRRGLPHKYLCVCGEQVPNKTLYLEGDVDEKGRPNGAGEIRAQNEYLVAPGTTITYQDLATNEEKTGMYIISKNVPIARIEYAEFMAAIKPFFGKNQSQTITPEEMANGVSAGMRHAKGIRYACHLIGKTKLDAQTALFEMQRWNQLNNPPMEERDLKRMVRDACRYIANENQIPIEQVIGCGGIKNPIFAELDQDEPEPTEQKQQDNQRESQADRMYKLFCETANIDLFYDQNKTEYARIPLDTPDNNATNAINGILTSNILSIAYKREGYREGSSEAAAPPRISCGNTVNSVNSVIYREIVRLDSEKFKQYLTHLLYDAEEKLANTESKNQVITLLKYDASKGKQIHLYNRVAPDPQSNGFWLDTANAYNQAYHITKDGWTLETDVPILFRREEHQQALADATPNGDVKLLYPFLNIGAGKDNTITKRRRLLLLVQTASYFIPEIPHPINAMFGVPGSHKSCTQRYIRTIIDPSAAPLLRIPRDENAALQVFDHHYIPIFDQIFSMSQWFSDMSCSAVTGAGQESRALYTNDKPFIRSFRRCVMMNGVNLPATKGDVLSRTILHPTGPAEQTLTEQELDAEYAKVLPSILGGFLDVTVKAMNFYGTPEAKPTKKFRMADFTEWGCAIALAFGETATDFIVAMEENLSSQTSSDIENNNVAEAFLAYLNGDVSFRAYTEDTPYSTTPTYMFHVTEVKAEELGTKIKNPKKWPSITSAFTRKLNDSKNAIIASGWNYDIFSDGKSSKRVMSIWSTKNPVNLIIAQQLRSYPGRVCQEVDKECSCPLEAVWDLNSNLYCEDHYQAAKLLCNQSGKWVCEKLFAAVES